MTATAICSTRIQALDSRSTTSIPTVMIVVARVSLEISIVRIAWMRSFHRPSNLTAHSPTQVAVNSVNADRSRPIWWYPLVTTITAKPTKIAPASPNRKSHCSRCWSVNRSRPSVTDSTAEAGDDRTGSVAAPSSPAPSLRASPMSVRTERTTSPPALVVASIVRPLLTVVLRRPSRPCPLWLPIGNPSATLGPGYLLRAEILGLSSRPSVEP
jgi:hypothetical protein